MANDRPLSLLSGDSGYMKAGGQFTNTCVLDSFLAGLHISCRKYKNVMFLLNGCDFFREVISLLEQKKYTDARRRCVKQLKLNKDDLFGSVKDYLQLIATLECVTITYKSNSPNDSAICEEIPSILLKCGDIMALGPRSEPTLILVHREVRNDFYQDCLSTELPLCVDNNKKRIFAVQFLLLGEDKHMTMCFLTSDNLWYLYDNDPAKSPFQKFDIKSGEKYEIYLAVYVNQTQAQEEKLSIAETGEAAGAKPFISDMSSFIHSDPGKLVEDMEIDDSLSYSIPETGEHLGPTPFFETQPVEDIEMVSCSSSDSDL